MAENDPQESCTTKTFWSSFYDSPCFWLKTISLLIVIGLAVFGLYQIVTSALHYFSEPLSYFDPERLGQLGDFLGGTLNPIFGFATVCLLLWSIFIQRKELILSREEFKKTASALESQVRISEIEHKFSNLEKSATHFLNRIDQLSNIKISTSKSSILDKLDTSINDAIHDLSIIFFTDIFDNLPLMQREIVGEFKKNVIYFIDNVREINRLLQHESDQHLKIYWTEKARYWIQACSKLQIFNTNEAINYRETIDKSFESKAL